MEKTIKCIEEKTASNKKQYLIVDFTDKTRMSCWMPEMFPILQVGNTIRLTSKTQGDYEIITSAFIVENPIDETIQAVKETNEYAKPQASLMSAKDVSITAQCLTKCFASSSYEDPKVIMDAYRFFVLELEQNG